jgi:Zn-finger nucleic acid-binding protein
VRLVACPECRAQYDVETVEGTELRCRCGATVDVRPRTAVDAEVRRCGSCGAVVTAGGTSCEFCGSAILRDRRDLHLLCPECFARNAEGSRFCTACGLEFRPEPIPGDDGPEPSCPDCATEMAARSVAGLAVRECPDCHGLWVPEDRFDALVTRAVELRRTALGGEGPAPDPRVTAGNPVATAVRYRKCPVCGELMMRRNWRKRSGVIVDRCREHGTWLDADELEQIAGFIASGGMERAEAAEREAARRALAAGLAGPHGHAGSELTRALVERDLHRGQRRLLTSFLDYLGELFAKP